MASLASPLAKAQDLEPCMFPQLNKVFTSTDEQVISSVDLSLESRIALQNFCLRQEIHLKSVIQAVWALGLRTYLGSDTTLFGYKNHEICGNRFDAAHSILQHLRRTTTTKEKAVPISWSGKRDDIAKNLFNTKLFVNSDDEDVNEPETDEEDFKTTELVVRYKSKDAKASIEIKHNLSYFDAVQGQRIVRTMRSILAKVVSDASISIGDLDLLDKDDLEQIWAWNDVIPQDPDVCAHDLLRQQAQETPSASAIRSWDGNLTYAEFDSLSSVLGRHLSAKGIVPNMVIPICFEKCKWTIVSMIAVLKAGAAFTTLDPIQPTDRLVDTIKETGSRIVLVGTSQRERFEGHDLYIISNVPDLAQISPVPDYTSASLAVKPIDLCYVAFTSGSTGRPKGVAHQHLAACTSITTKARDGSDSGYGPGKSIMQFASQAFAASVVEIFKTLGNGGCICIPSEQVRLNNITEFMKENTITRVFFPPTLLKLFKPEMFPTLETLLTGGEPVLPDLIAMWAPKLKFVEAVGMTEGVAITTNIKADGTMTRLAQSMSGVPWIVDPDDYNRLVPIGALGELMVEGPCLAQGYLHDEEKTSAAFIEAPKWARSGDFPGRKFRMYRTGDMARYFSDGVVRLLGRRDTRVKLNGQRIELGEVEAHMKKNLPDSMAAAAEVVTTSQNRSFLVGFLFSSTDLGIPGDPQHTLLPPGTCNNIRELLPVLKKQMSQALPIYMVPTVFLPFSRRPTNMSGKMDRKKLRQIASGLSKDEVIAYSSVEDHERTAPSTNTEKLVASLWASLFGIGTERISLEDNFMVLGGDSLQAIRLGRMARELGHTLSTREILQNPILKDMALVARPNPGQRPTSNATQMPSVSAEVFAKIQEVIGIYAIETISKATDWQSWAVSTGLLKTRGWTDYLIFDFKGPLDVVQLEDSCKALLKLVPILRTVFAVDARRVFQVVLEDYPFHFQKFESGDIDAKTISQQIFSQDATSKTFIGEPIVRFSLIGSSGTYRLLMRLSHAQYDVISLASLLGVLKKLYSGEGICASPSFADFVNFTANDDSEGESFWRQLLEGSKMTEIRPHNKPSHSNIIDTALKRTVQLPALQGHGITIASLVLSSWAVALSQLSNSSDVIFGRLTSGRHAAMAGIQDVVGPCMNITPVRAHVDGGMGFQDFVEKLQSQHIASLSFENVGFRHIVEDCTNWAPWTRFSSIVNHVHIGENMKDAFNLSPDLTYDFDVHEPMHDKSDMWLQTKPVGMQMEVELRFSKVAISNDQAERALQLFCDVFKLSSTAFQTPLQNLLSASKGGSSEDLQTLVKNAWKRVFVDEKSPSLVGAIGLDMPFYEVWGDLIGSAALCKLYCDCGFEVSVEDIFHHPTMREQVILLGSVKL